MNELALIPIALLTSLIAAVFGMGGGVPLIALMPGFVPAAAIIPVHAVTQLASNGSRMLFGFRHIDYSLIPPFLFGALFGASLGAQVFQRLDLQWLPAIMGLVILLITWLPLPLLKGAGRWPLVLLGFYQTGIGMIIGASGPLGAALLARRDDRRDWLVVNTAVYMTSNHLIRTLTFAFMGFAFAPYLWLMLGMIAAVVVGSWLGTRLRKHVPQANFQLWFKLLVTVLALRMIIISFL